MSAGRGPAEVSVRRDAAAKMDRKDISEKGCMGMFTENVYVADRMRVCIEYSTDMDEKLK